MNSNEKNGEPSAGLWGGRFKSRAADSVFALSRSVHFDWRLAPYDLVSSRAHVASLTDAGVISKEVAAQLDKALTELISDVASGKFQPLPTDEDVHSALERGLKEKLGDIGGAIRAGRSRNDQVATDLKLYLIDQMLEIAHQLTSLQEALLKKSDEYKDALAPGFTHLQHAQPILFGHELAKHAVALERDLSRIIDWRKRTSTSPLGAGALAGSSLVTSPEKSAHQLGFAGVAANSIDAVSDRDYVAEALFIIALIGVHLSRVGEEWTIWSSSEFGWAKLDDAYATGSSIMPQKKNPDIAELARGKAGRFIGDLTGLLTTLKGLPFAYNRDLQEDKESTFDAVENLLLLLPPVTGMISSTAFVREKMAAGATTGFALATEIADFLARKGLPFSIAHEAAGRCVRICEEKGIELDALSNSDLVAVHPLLEGVHSALNAKSAVNARSSANGTALSSVTKQIAALEQNRVKNLKWISDERDRFSGMMSQ